MSAIKERILGALTVMSDEDAATVWEIILKNFSEKQWNNIDAVQPDDWDLKMLDDIKNNPDCNMFFDYESARKELGI